MKVLYIDYQMYGKEDIIEAFCHLGHEVDVCDAPLRFGETSEETQQTVYTQINNGRYDFVFTSNYYPMISCLCEDLGTKYISWTYDSPRIALYDRSILNQCNYAFTFDSDECNTLRNMGVSTVYYMPLAVNPVRIHKLQISDQDRRLFSADVSLVASLYNEEHNLYDRMAKRLDPYTKGYLEGAMQAQKKWNCRRILMDGIWEEIHAKMTWGEYPPEHVIRFVARNYYGLNREQIRILDFGCGQGANTWYLAREGFDTYAFDGSENAVLKCKEKLRKEGLTANIKVSDGIFIDYPSDYFDAVIDNACIYANEIINIKEMYCRIFNILKPGGKILISCFGEELGGYKTGTEIEPGTYQDIREGVLANRGLAHIFTEEELRVLLQEIGFMIEQCDWIRYMDGGNMVHQIIYIGRKPSDLI